MTTLTLISGWLQIWDCDGLLQISFKILSLNTLKQYNKSYNFYQSIYPVCMMTYELLMQRTCLLLIYNALSYNKALLAGNKQAFITWSYRALIIWPDDKVGHNFCFYGQLRSHLLWSSNMYRWCITIICYGMRWEKRWAVSDGNLLCVI